MKTVMLQFDALDEVKRRAQEALKGKKQGARPVSRDAKAVHGEVHLVE